MQGRCVWTDERGDMVYSELNGEAVGSGNRIVGTFIAGPAGVVAALRAADLGAKTALITGDEFGGMTANDGPVPVRKLAHAARLIREARQLGRYGVAVSEPVLDPRLIARVRAVVDDVRAHSAFRQQIDSVA
jgi:pyruvate/2-oxoglutarate dehydrogenase complex dihydrolipoamide dehydrogenase (E3) component